MTTESDLVLGILAEDPVGPATLVPEDLNHHLILFGRAERPC
jgi:hypothetical protein